MCSLLVGWPLWYRIPRGRACKDGPCTAGTYAEGLVSPGSIYASDSKYGNVRPYMEARPLFVTSHACSE